MKTGILSIVVLTTSITSCSALLCQQYDSGVNQAELEASSFTDRNLKAALVAQGLILDYQEPAKTMVNSSYIPMADEWVWMTDDHRYSLPEFVRAKDGKVYHLVRIPEYVGYYDSKSFTICGCPPVGQGAAPNIIEMVYNNIAGEKTVRYRAKSVRITYSKRDCPQPV